MAVFFRQQLCQTLIIHLSIFSNSIGEGASALFVVGASASDDIFMNGGITIDKIIDLPNEEWKEIEGYGGKYLVSNMGRIKSLKYNEAHLLTAFPNNKGY